MPLWWVLSNCAERLWYQLLLGGPQIMPLFYFLHSDFCKLRVLPVTNSLFFLSAVCGGVCPRSGHHGVYEWVVSCFNWGQHNLLGWKSCRSHSMMFATCASLLGIRVTDLMLLIVHIKDNVHVAVSKLQSYMPLENFHEISNCDTSEQMNCPKDKTAGLSMTVMSAMPSCLLETTTWSNPLRVDLAFYKDVYHCFWTWMFKLTQTHKKEPSLLVIAL